MSEKILYVEDDEALSFITIDQLQQAGYTVVHCKDGREALEKYPQHYFDIAVLDIMLPFVDGFSIAEKIRESNKEMPILFLSAKSLEEDRLKGFQLGADDFLVKPFSMEELIFKIKVFLKRKNINIEKQGNLSIGKFTLKPNELLLLHQNSNEQKMTVKEVALFQLLINHPNQTLQRSKILTEIWGKDDYFLGRSLDVFIARLRKYLKQDPQLNIETIRGVGFRLNVEK